VIPVHLVQRLEVQEVGDVSVARFRDPRVTNPMEIEELGRELYQVLEYKNCSKLVLDFSAVEFLSSATIGKLISLGRKAKLCKAELRLCNMRPEICEIFRLCNLERVFDLRESVAAAVASLP
jgi:anti-sigma B factor antagonist